MRDYTQSQYEKVARYLDGEAVSLSAQEQALAEAIADDEQFVAGRLNVVPPAKAKARATRQIAAVLKGRSRRWGRWEKVAKIAVSSAIAATLLMAVINLFLPHEPQKTVATDINASTDRMLEAIEEQDIFELEVEFVTEQVHLQQAAMAVNGETDLLDGEFEQLEQEIDTFWIEENIGESIQG